jgi:putative membrane-bound dehydrogenase-like protein
MIIRFGPAGSWGIGLIFAIGVAMLGSLVLNSPGTAQETSLDQESRNALPQEQHRTSNAPFLEPAEAVRKMAIPKGFEVSIFAAEPDIAEPIAFCFDHQGRIWVAENFNYRTRQNHTLEPVSRIQILEDSNGDGVFDNKKTFTDALTFTSGLAVGHGGVFVGSPPNLSFIPDADGDDQPDGPPQVLLDGWGIQDRHETLNSFNWGPDGWLYGCHGVFTRSQVGKPGAKADDRQFIDGGIWRYHPVEKKFEIFARGLSNPWGFDFDDHGQGFATCCVIPHLFHVVQGGIYTKQSLPHVNPYVFDEIKTIRDHSHLSAHGGARFYLADVFPAPYNQRNQLFMCNIHEHAVLSDYMVPNGSSFVGKHGADFMPTNDLAWVGFSIELGPEGGVYILDWHDTDVCGNAINFPNSGRIYRIMPKASKPFKRKDLTAMSDTELIDLQANNNDWYVRHARTILHHRATTGELNHPNAVSQLESLLRSAQESRKRLRALWALQVIGGLSERRLSLLLDHDDPYVRSWCIQFLCERSQSNAFQSQPEQGVKLPDGVLKKFERMASRDRSQIVRLYLASAVQRLKFEDRWSILQGLISHREDVTDKNLPRMYWFGLEPMVPHNPDRALELVVGGKIPKLSEFVARRIASGNATVVPYYEAKKSVPRKEWQEAVQAIAPGFKIKDVGEGGVVLHKSFRNRMAVQTHPQDRQSASQFYRKVFIADDLETRLNLRVSHHPHGDWQLRVLADGKPLLDRIIGTQTVGENEWYETSVDLTRFAGTTIELTVENRANNWLNEWAYWNRVQIERNKVFD